MKEDRCVFKIISFFKKKSRMTSYFYYLLPEEVSCMEISWKLKIHKILSVFQKVSCCHFTVAFKSHTDADEGARHFSSRTAKSTIRISFAVARPNGQQSASLHVCPPKCQSVPVYCIRIPYKSQMGKQGMPAQRQPHPRVQPALQLHDTMRISLSGAGGKSIWIGRREPWDRIHPPAVGLMLLLNLTIGSEGILTGNCTSRWQVCHLENTVHWLKAFFLMNAANLKSSKLLKVEAPYRYIANILHQLAMSSGFAWRVLKTVTVCFSWLFDSNTLQP